MAKYVILCSWTQKGIESVKNSPERLAAAKKAFEAVGGELQEFYLTMGHYDMVVLVEVPDDEAIAKVALMVGSGGAIRTETLRAFPEDEYTKIVAALP